MEKTSKRRELSDGKQENTASIDRLSDLQDDILCRILAYLPTIRSVQTSVLARRWRSVWAHAHCLNFRKKHLKGEDRFAKHSDIIHRVMFSHKSKILNTFLLSKVHCTCYQLETWIGIAILRNIRNLYVRLSRSVTMPRCIFTCKTLVELGLYGVCIPSSGDRVFLPSLKKLHLCSVGYLVDEVLPHLISGCPVLEKLSVLDEIWHKGNGWEGYNISSPTVKSLEVGFGYDCYAKKPNYMMKINASALRYLRVKNCSYKHIMISPATMTSLVEANIRLDYYERDEDKSYGSYVMKFLDCLYNVKCLKLLGCYNEKVIVETGSNVKFNNLTRLELEFAIGWRSLLKFIEIADNLEVLNLSSVIGWIEPKQVPPCLISHLRSMRIDRMMCSQREFRVVKYFLMNAKVLERMEIISPHDECFMEKSDVLLKISSFERGSKECKVATSFN